MFQTLLTTLNYGIKSIQLLNGTTDESVKYVKVQIELKISSHFQLCSVETLKTCFVYKVKCFML